MSDIQSTQTASGNSQSLTKPATAQAPAKVLPQISLPAEQGARENPSVLAAKAKLAEDIQSTQTALENKTALTEQGARENPGVLTSEEKLTNPAEEISEQKKIDIQIEQKQKELAKLESQKQQLHDSEKAKAVDFSTKSWQAEYEAVVGIKHRKPHPPQLGQDSAFAIAASEHQPFSAIISADGAGSSEMSDVGSQLITSSIYRFIHTLYLSHFSALDKTEEIELEKARHWSLILAKHAIGTLGDIARQYRRQPKDFRCTLLLCVVGKQQTFWFKVGDGALVKQTAQYDAQGQLVYQLKTIGEVGKEEYANETTFISENLNPEKVQFGVFSNESLSALFTMSDGGTKKLVSNDGSEAAERLSTFAEKLRQNRLKRYDLTKFFYSEEFTQGHDGDDCSIALIAR